MTSVTSNTILASLASLFAFFGSVLCLGEQFTAPKLVFIALAVAGRPPQPDGFCTCYTHHNPHDWLQNGCALTVVSCCAGSGLVAAADDSGDSHDSLVGDALCIVSGICYAAYTICIQLFLQAADQVHGFARICLWR